MEDKINCTNTDLKDIYIDSTNNMLSNDIYLWNNFLNYDQIILENDKIYKNDLKIKFKDFTINELNSYLLMLYNKIKLLYYHISVNNENIQYYNKKYVYILNSLIGLKINKQIQKYHDENLTFSSELIEAKRQIYYIKIIINEMIEKSLN